MNRILAAGFALAGAALIASDSDAASSGYTVRKSVFSAGSAYTSDSATYRVRGSIGQPAVTRSTSATHQLKGGFWTAALPAATPIFRDGFEEN